jgi:hypothetical protein
MSVYSISIGGVDKIEVSKHSADDGKLKWMKLALGGCEITIFKTNDVKDWPEFVEVPGHHEDYKTPDEELA